MIHSYGRSNLERIEELCLRNGEDALRFCSECMIRLSKDIDKTEMPKDVKDAISLAFSEAEGYYISEAEDCMGAKSAKARTAIFQDIEDSIISLYEMFDAVKNSEDKADYCGRYSFMLDQYAGAVNTAFLFCVYPSVRSHVETRIIFRGEVCLIGVPENRLTDKSFTEHVLIHELFNVLPGWPKRKNVRAVRLTDIYIHVLWPFLTIGIGELSDDENDRIQNLALANFRTRTINRVGMENQFSNALDSGPLRDYFVQQITKLLVELPRQLKIEKMIRIVSPDTWPKDFDEYRRYDERARMIRNTLIFNAENLIVRNKVGDMCDFYMTLIRDTLSDLLSLIALCEGPGTYFKNLVWQMGSKMVDYDDYAGNTQSVYLKASLIAEIMNSPAVFDISEEGGLTKQMTRFEMWRDAGQYFDSPEDKELRVFYERVRAVSSEDGRKLWDEVLGTEDKDGRAAAESKMNGDASAMLSDGSQSPDFHWSLNDAMRKVYINYLLMCCIDLLYHEEKNRSEFDDFEREYFDKK